MMNWADYTIIAVIGISVLISILRGFTKEAFSLAGWIVSVWVAITFANNLELQLRPHIEDSSIRMAVAFAILFFATLFLAAWVNFLAVQLIKKTGLSGTDRMVGLFFGLARGALVVAILVLMAGMTPMPGDRWWGESQFLHYFQDIAIWLKSYLPTDIAKSIHY